MCALSAWLMQSNDPAVQPQVVHSKRSGASKSYQEKKSVCLGPDTMDKREGNGETDCPAVMRS